MLNYAYASHDTQLSFLRGPVFAIATTYDLFGRDERRRSDLTQTVIMVSLVDVPSNGRNL